MKVPAALRSRLVVWAALVAAFPATGHATQATSTVGPLPQMARVPSLVDRPLQTGKQMIQRSGLVVGQEIPVKSGATPGTILWQSIPRDSVVPFKTVIHLRYATPGTFDGPTDRAPAVDSTRVSKPSGPSTKAVIAAAAIAAVILSQLGSDSAAAPVAVPDLRDTTIGRAREILEELGLSLGRVDSTKSASGTGLILTQRPAAGAAVKRGTPVRVAVEVSPPIRVPNVIGKTESEAIRMIEGAKLRLGVVDSVPRDSSLGTVVGQSPAPDSPVWQGSRVGFQVGVQGRWSTVPSLIDSTSAAAARVLESAGLRLGRVDTVPRAGGNGLITHQAPLAGTRAARGIAVRVMVQAPGSGTIAETQSTDSTIIVQSRTLVVPSVVDSAPDAARSVLEAAGFQGVRIDSVERAAGTGVVVFQLPRAGTELSAPVEVVLQVAVLRQVADAPEPKPPTSWAWIIVVGAGVGAGATALLRGRTRERKHPEQEPEPEVSFRPHSAVAWQPAEEIDDPFDGPELRFAAGAGKADVEFQGEP